jgi:transposase InsO family protein
VPNLIRMLGSDDPLVRMTAIRTLERITGLTHGYHFAAPESEREAAIRQWVRWYRHEGPRSGAIPAEAQFGTGGP